MRDIKFREWDPLRQEMYESGGISYGVREDFDDMIAFRFAHTENIDGDLSKERVLEQYTGLKDKNGVEIYEGDIVKISGGRITVVEYKHGSYDPVYWYSSDAIKVIGNIHENVDLLVDDIERMIPDDIGNDIHEFLHGGDKR